MNTTEGGARASKEIDVVSAARLLRSPWTEGVLEGRPLVVVDLDSAGDLSDLQPPALLPAILVGVSRAAEPPDMAGCQVDIALSKNQPAAAPWVDGEAEEIEAAVEANPTAAVTLVQVLRSSAGAPIPAGLVIESLAYSTLQGGAEFQDWLGKRRPRQSPEAAEDPVLVHRHGDHLEIVLNRPEVHNAYNTAIRDALSQALALAGLDDRIAAVNLAGAGPSFCSGGDLTEFGSFPDPATAHLVRTGRSPAQLLARLGPKVSSDLHGACVGSGIELPAFGSKVRATADSRIRLPEVGMGLIPGAGGTVSLPLRIGRQRTAWLALTGREIDAATARSWGLVDEIIDSNG